MERYFILKVKVDDECVAVVDITGKRWKSLSDVASAVEMIYDDDAVFTIECKLKGVSPSGLEEGKEGAA